MMHTRSSALGTRIVAPPPVPAVSESPHTVPKSWNRSKARKSTKRTGTARNTPRPTSAPHKRVGIVSTAFETPLFYPRGRGSATTSDTRRCNGDVVPGNHAPSGSVRIRAGRGGKVEEERRYTLGVEGKKERFRSPGARGQSKGCRVRSRPASAQPPSRASAKPTAAALPRRQDYRSRHLAPPWDDASSGGGSGGDDGSGGGGGGQRRNHASLAAARSRAEGGMQMRWWDDCCAVGMGPATRRAVAAKVAAASAASEAAASGKNKSASPDRIQSAATAGRPYMSRAERALEESKDIARLRAEVIFWRERAGRAEEEAAGALRRLKGQEEYAARVLQQTAEALPAYRYGLDLSGVSGASALTEPQLFVLEHRRELEKGIIVRRLKGQISQLTERLAIAEGELVHLKRSCQFTALAEMLTAGEEYVNEVERLRAKLSGADENAGGVPGNKKRCDARPCVVDIPVGPKPSKPAETSGIEVLSAIDSAEHPWSDGTRSVSSPRETFFQSHQNLQHQKTRSPGNSQEGHHATKRPVLSTSQSSPKNANNERRREGGCSRYGGKYIEPASRRPLQKPENPYRLSSSQPNRQRDSGYGRGVCGVRAFRARVRAGLLGVPGATGNGGLLTIDAPMRGARATAGTGRNAIDRGYIGKGGRGGGVETTAGGGGRVAMTSEMEIDVMKGLVLAQHQRIEKQRSKMQELEQDLRDCRRAALGCGEWPEASWLPSPSKQFRSDGWKRGLTPSRSAPAGLDCRTRKQQAAAVTAPQNRSSHSHAIGSSLGHSDRASGQRECVKRFDVGDESGAGTRRRRESVDRLISLPTTRPRPASANRDQSERRRLYSTGKRVNSRHGKPRPKSASSRLVSAPGRSRTRCDEGGGTEVDYGFSIEGGKAGRLEEGLKEEEAGVYQLPGGWAEAVDEESGHIYYYSETRSTWEKPTIPASPQVCEAAGAQFAVNTKDAMGDRSSTNLFAAATNSTKSFQFAGKSNTADEGNITNKHDVPTPSHAMKNAVKKEIGTVAIGIHHKGVEGVGQRDGEQTGVCEVEQRSGLSAAIAEQIEEQVASFPGVEQFPRKLPRRNDESSKEIYESLQKEEEPGIDHGALLRGSLLSTDSHSLLPQNALSHGIATSNKNLSQTEREDVYSGSIGDQPPRASARKTCGQTGRTGQHQQVAEENGALKDYVCCSTEGNTRSEEGSSIPETTAFLPASDPSSPIIGTLSRGDVRVRAGQEGSALHFRRRNIDYPKELKRPPAGQEDTPEKNPIVFETALQPASGEDQRSMTAATEGLTAAPDPLPLNLSAAFTPDSTTSDNADGCLDRGSYVENSTEAHSQEVQCPQTNTSFNAETAPTNTHSRRSQDLFSVEEQGLLVLSETSVAVVDDPTDHPNYGVLPALATETKKKSGFEGWRGAGSERSETTGKYEDDFDDD